MSTKFDDIPLRIYRGDSEAFTFTIKDDAGDALDLSGYTIKAQARKTPDDTHTIFDISITDTAPSDFEKGIVVLNVSDTITAKLGGSYAYDIQASDGTTTMTLARGTISVLKDITR